MSTFTFPVRVYWEDTDAGGIVYYANYLKFMERARTELLRSFGIHQNQLAQEQGVMFAIVSVNIDYLLPARLDDLLQITCTIMAEGRASFAFSQDVYRERVGGELLTRARTRAACLDCATLRPRRLPESLLQALARHEG
ncbi:MAG TPA: tol-pal system-associated acyl-CoA thioesterase [Steroidobacteraceae bacterium]|jgi:acyl-CoA thioester hydrolase|nr:tol-pal system-associated acyl-CoA thioesterase [Steroidobacteraceae bacterium]